MTTFTYWAKCLALDGFVFALAAAGLVWNISGAWDVFIFWNWVFVVLGMGIALAPTNPRFEPRPLGAGAYHWATEVLTISILVATGHPTAATFRLVVAFLVEGVRRSSEEGGAA